MSLLCSDPVLVLCTVGEAVGICKETVVPYFKVLTRRLPQETEENNEDLSMDSPETDRQTDRGRNQSVPCTAFRAVSSQPPRNVVSQSSSPLLVSQTIGYFSSAHAYQSVSQPVNQSILVG